MLKESQIFFDHNFGGSSPVDPYFDETTLKNAEEAERVFGLPRSLWKEMTIAIRGHKQGISDSSVRCRNFEESLIMFGFAIGYLEGSKSNPYEERDANAGVFQPTESLKPFPSRH